MRQGGGRSDIVVTEVEGRKQEEYKGSERKPSSGKRLRLVLCKERDEAGGGRTDVARGGAARTEEAEERFRGRGRRPRGASVFLCGAGRGALLRPVRAESQRRHHCRREAAVGHGEGTVAQRRGDPKSALQEVEKPQSAREEGGRPGGGRGGRDDEQHPRNIVDGGEEGPPG